MWHLKYVFLVPWALISSPGSVEEASVRQDNFQIKTVVPYGPVAHGVGSAGPGGAHAADGRVRPGVDREPESIVLQEVVEALPGRGRG